MLLRLASQDGSVKSVRASQYGPFISHLFFADDSLIFGEEPRMGATNLKMLLKECEEFLGQLVNFEKSLVYFNSNV